MVNVEVFPVGWTCVRALVRFRNEYHKYHTTCCLQTFVDDYNIPLPWHYIANRKHWFVLESCPKPNMAMQTVYSCHFLFGAQVHYVILTSTLIVNNSHIRASNKCNIKEILYNWDAPAQYTNWTASLRCYIHEGRGLPNAKLFHSVNYTGAQETSWIYSNITNVPFLQVPWRNSACGYMVPSSPLLQGFI